MTFGSNRERWREAYEVKETRSGNAEVIDKKTGRVVAMGMTGAMYFHARTLWDIERDRAYEEGLAKAAQGPASGHPRPSAGT